MEAFFNWFAEFFTEIWAGISDFFTWIMEFVLSIPDILREFLKYCFKQFIYSSIAMGYWAFEFCWEVAQDILNDLGVTETLNSAYNKLDADIRAVLNYLRIPDCINMLLSAFGTKFTLRFLPGKLF